MCISKTFILKGICHTFLEMNDVFIRCTDVSASRRFYINISNNLCTGEYGWVAVLESGSVCSYDSNLAYPYFAYMPNNIVGHWETGKYKLNIKQVNTIKESYIVLAICQKYSFKTGHG